MRQKFLELFEEIDNFTGGHSARVSYLAIQIAKNMNLDNESLRKITMGAALHDIGKLQIPAEILFSGRELTCDEWDVIHKHPKLGFDMIAVPYDISDYAEIIYNHHETLDGKGYPRGLRDYELSMEVRIVTAADIFEAIIADRGPVNPPKTISQAKEIMFDMVSLGKLDKSAISSLFNFIEDEGLTDTSLRPYLNASADMLVESFKINVVSEINKQENHYVPKSVLQI